MSGISTDAPEKRFAGASILKQKKFQVTKGFSFSVMKNSFQVLLCTNGEGGLETDGSNRPLRFQKGSCIFLPAGLGRCHVIGECDLLKVRC